MRSPLPISIFALLFATGTGVLAEEQDSEFGRTLVTVNDKELTQMHFAVYRSQFGRDLGDEPQAQMRILNELINTTMVAQAAEKANLQTDPQVVAAVDVARARILAQAAIQTHLNENPIEEEEVQAAFKTQYSDAEAGKEYKARHILLKSEDDAKAVIEALDAGGDFATLAKEKSTGPSGPSGGDLGWFEPDQMVAPFAEATAAMDKGTYSKTPVQTEFGYHVILLEDVRETQPPAYADVRPALLDRLRQQRAADYIRGIREDTKVEFAPAPEAPQESAGETSENAATPEQAAEEASAKENK